MAEAMATGIFVDPGPQEVKVTAGRWVTRQYASAMWPAACSWWTEMVRISPWTSYRASRRPMFPCPHRPKAKETPSQRSRSTMTCAPVLESTVTIVHLPAAGTPRPGPETAPVPSA